MTKNTSHLVQAKGQAGTIWHPLKHCAPAEPPSQSLREVRTDLTMLAPLLRQKSPAMYSSPEQKETSLMGGSQNTRRPNVRNHALGSIPNMVGD